VRRTVDQGTDEARERFEQAARLGIDMKALTGGLQADGVALFRESFNELLAGIERKRAALPARQEGRMCA
jgi:transaldolase